MVKFGLFLLILSSCASFHTWVDQSGLRDQGLIFKAQQIAKLQKTAVRSDSFKSNQILPKISELTTWRLPLSSEWKQLHLEFPGEFSHQKAVFFLYSKGLTGRRVILWIPGKGVSDLAFIFLKRLFLMATAQDYDILFYVMPFHMERTPKGMKNGEGLLSYDSEESGRQLQAATRELQTGLTYLSNRGVRSIAGWGGSMGAMLLSRIAQSGKWKHMVWMIPVIDWNTIANNSEIRPYLKPGADQVAKEFSPIYHHIKVDPNRMMIQAGKWDVLNPIDQVRQFAHKYNIRNLKIYPSGHGAILLMDGVYRDYQAFLKKINRK